MSMIGKIGDIKIEKAVFPSYEAMRKILDALLSDGFIYKINGEKIMKKPDPEKLRCELTIDYKKNTLELKGHGHRNAIFSLERFFREQYDKKLIVSYYVWDNVARMDDDSITRSDREKAEKEWADEQLSRLCSFVAGKFDNPTDEKKHTTNK